MRQVNSKVTPASPDTVPLAATQAKPWWATPPNPVAQPFKPAKILSREKWKNHGPLILNYFPVQQPLRFDDVSSYFRQITVKDKMKVIAQGPPTSKGKLGSDTFGGECYEEDCKPKLCKPGGQGTTPNGLHYMAGGAIFIRIDATKIKTYKLTYEGSTYLMDLV